MKSKKNKEKKKKGVSNVLERDIDNLIDDMAYLDESHNIKRSKSFLDDMYLLKE